MMNLKKLLVILVCVVMVSCGNTQESKQKSDQAQSDANSEVEMTGSTSADSVLNELEKSSQELQSITDEAQKAVDELSEDN